jgi:hypothetical protein
MSKTIRKVVTRQCCELEDLRDKDGKALSGPNGTPLLCMCPDRMWCKHCGQEHAYHRFTDAAGSTDWNYRPVQRKKRK